MGTKVLWCFLSNEFGDEGILSILKLIEESSRLMARELAAKGVHFSSSFTFLDLVKDPRWGRSEHVLEKILV